MHLVHREELGDYLNQAELLGTGVEVGVADGRFARSILEHWQGRRLVLVDCWEPQDPAEYQDVQNQGPSYHQHNFAQVTALVKANPRAEILRGFTPTAASHFADASLDFVYLDANHSYLAVRDDLRAWYPKVKPGGLLAGHDYLDGYLGFGPDFQGGTLFGVRTAVDEFCREVGQAAAFTTGDPPFLTWYFRKQPDRVPCRFTVLTGYEPSYAHLGEISCPNKEAYCRSHGYTFRCRTDGFDPTRPPAWSKVLFLLEELGESDWVFWTDADSLIMNSAMQLGWFLDETADLVLSRDRINGINTGCFFVKNSTWARAFLQRVYQQEQFSHHPWWENAAVMALYAQDPECRRHISLVPNKLFNAYLTDDSYAKGDFLLHFPGLNAREVFMKNYAAMAS